MYKTIVTALLAFVFLACSKPVPSPSQKVFDAEDVYIMYALRAEEVGRYDTAAKLFSQLYEKANKKEYLYRELQDLMAAKKFDAVVQKSDRILEDSKEVDLKILRIKVLSLLHQKKYDRAKEAAIALVKLSQKSQDYLLVAQSYVKLKNIIWPLSILKAPIVKIMMKRFWIKFL